jgi:hypothetical protein
MSNGAATHAAALPPDVGVREVGTCLALRAWPWCVGVPFRTIKLGPTTAGVELRPAAKRVRESPTARALTRRRPPGDWGSPHLGGWDALTTVAADGDCCIRCATPRSACNGPGWTPMKKRRSRPTLSEQASGRDFRSSGGWFYYFGRGGVWYMHAKNGRTT